MTNLPNKPPILYDPSPFGPRWTPVGRVVPPVGVYVPPPPPPPAPPAPPPPQKFITIFGIKIPIGIPPPPPPPPPNPHRAALEFKIFGKSIRLF